MPRQNAPQYQKFDVPLHQPVLTNLKHKNNNKLSLIKSQLQRRKPVITGVTMIPHLFYYTTCMLCIIIGYLNIVSGSPVNASSIEIAPKHDTLLKGSSNNIESTNEPTPNSSEDSSAQDEDEPPSPSDEQLATGMSPMSLGMPLLSDEPGSPSSPSGKTMVMVTTRNRRFTELVPLEDLIVNRVPSATSEQKSNNNIELQDQQRAAPTRGMVSYAPAIQAAKHRDDSEAPTEFDDDGLMSRIDGNAAATQNVRRLGHNQMGQIVPTPTHVRESAQDLNVAAGHHYKKKSKHHGGHGKYYMYAKVPKKGAWEFGYKRGNHKHKIERHEKGHKSHFKTKVKWHDKKSKGKGVHIWDYNHYDKKKKKHG